MLRNKKGSLQDMVLVAIILLFTSIVVLIGFKVMTNLDTEIQDHDFVDARGKAASSTLKGYYPGIIDNSFLFLAIGLSIITIVLAAMVRVHPMFIALFFIGLIAVIFACGMFSNIYQDMAANTNLSTEADQLVFISNIMEYLPLIVGIFGFLIMIIMYKTWRNAQDL